MFKSNMVQAENGRRKQPITSCLVSPDAKERRSAPPCAYSSYFVRLAFSHFLFLFFSGGLLTQEIGQLFRSFRRSVQQGQLQFLLYIVG
jgi:hypothetical protein